MKVFVKILVLILVIPGNFASSFDVELTDSLDTDLFYVSNGWKNGDSFDCAWYSSQVTFTGCMKLKVDNVGCPSSCLDTNFRSAEVGTKNKLGHGYFGAVIIIPKDAEGLMSGSVFTYDDTSKDEIDIEFTGKNGGVKFDTNYYYMGDMTNHHTVINLDFDATDDFHEFGFVWQTSSITWFVDGNQVHSMTIDIPTNNMNLLLNIWPGNMTKSGMESWLGTLDYTTPVDYQVKRIRYVEGATTYPCEGDDCVSSKSICNLCIISLVFFTLFVLL